MVKDRLIFTLLYGESKYNLSRNFSLQRVGDLGWVRENYEFNSIARSIDELIVLDVSRGERNIDSLAGQVEQLAQTCFMPIAAGGGIRSIDHAYRLFQAGADKLVLNSALFSDSGLVVELSRTFGAQSIVASVDFRLGADGVRRVYCRGGRENTGLDLEQAVELIQKVGAGELYLTSINKDGTGDGYDLEGLAIAAAISSVPIIASGGAGNHVHFVEALRSGHVNAVSTANLFNFMCDGLQEARAAMLREGINLSVWTPF